MPTATDPMIAEALKRFLAVRLSERPSARAFFRLAGFGEDVYVALLDSFAAAGWRLGEMSLEVRSIGPIPGHADRILEEEHSATWYRNHLVSGQALVLIQNRRSTDAQSLKDLFSVTERVLSRDGLDQLIDACCTRYQLDHDKRKTLSDFVRKVARMRYEPQLRDLAEFLAEVDNTLAKHPGTPIGRAIVLALPYLGLFRCLDLEPELATPRGERLLRDLHRAARIGSEVLEERTRADYLRRLETAPLDDDESLGGQKKEQKRGLLRRFIEGELRDDPAGRRQVLEIDWREVQLVITARARRDRKEKLAQLANRLAAELPEQEAEEAGEALADVWADLRAEREPDGDAIDRLLAEHGEALPKSLRTELRRLVRQRTRKHGDFLVGLTALAIELLQPLQAELRPGVRLEVTPKLEEASDAKRLPEALVTFRAMFGGLEEVMPSVDWRLQALWERAAEQQDSEAEDDQEREQLARLELPFRVIVKGPDDAELARAELVWQYRSDSPSAATALTLAAELERLQQNDFGAQSGATLRVPIFNSCPRSEEIGDLDIRRPIHSLGAWFDEPSNLRDLLEAQLGRRARPETKAALLQALDKLEAAWGTLVAVAAERGLLAADIAGLVAAYDGLLQAAVAQLRSSGEAGAGFKALSQAWIIGPKSFERWAVMPLLHPLKLLWWRERARYFDRIVSNLLDPAQPTNIVDEPRFRRELAATYGSSGFPPVLALPPGEGLPPARFLPVEEADGYELYFREAASGEPFGLATDDLADDEAAIAAQRAVEGIAAVVQDYLETYPFVRDGLEIVLYDCRNGALPGLLVERLAQLGGRRGEQPRLSVIVHTEDRGAPLFQRVSAWVKAEHVASDRRGADYFPPVSLKVLQCSPEELLQTREDTDLVVLADVLAGQGQSVLSELDDDAPPDVAAEGWLPTAQAQQEPFQQGELYRRLQLSHSRQPAVVRRFLLAQHGALEQRAVRPEATARFYRELTLTPWERLLRQLHEHFNWVICYDPSIDRFLLKGAFPDEVQVIRYSLGLGAKRQHNLTVSSSHKARAIVERRLASRLAQMLPQAKPVLLRQVAEQLVVRANEISGDIVLRAAGPGAFLNELIGLVVAKFETERRYRARRPDDLRAWILLDDFEHWFGAGKFPDLLFVAIGRDEAGGLRLHLEVLEAKCVGQLSFEREAADAQIQVRRGVSRLAPAFAPGKGHLDALYWYDQLYRAVVGNLQVEYDQQELWELLRDRLHDGAFQATFEGHSWAFCYDGQAGVTDGPDERPFEKSAEGAPAVPLVAHYYGRNELCRALRQLIEEGGESDVSNVPPEAWTPASDAGPGEEAPVDEPPAGDTPVAVVPAPPDNPPPPDNAGADQVAVEQAPPVAPVAPPEADPMPEVAPPPADAPAPLSEQEQTWLKEKARDLERALRQRGVQVFPVDPALADVGPSVVRFKLRLRPNETLRKIQGVAEDLARDLALIRTPFIGNVLGTNFVGVDIPREQAQLVALGPLLGRLGTPGTAELPIVIGVTPDGNLLVEDLSEFPHLLVAGVTGSGKSVFLRGLLLSLMTQYRPGQLELLIVDPKQTDFSFFDGLPYLRGGKVFTQPEEARDALLDLVRNEMPRRQQLMKGRSFKIKDFNKRFPAEALPPIVALIDEYAQLLSIQAKKEAESFERDLMSLAAVARATGIHLVLATQRPSVDVVTGTLKANLPTRIAFYVPTNNDSRVVLDTTGAENLIGRGDMLFRRPSGEIVRLQAPYMDEEEMQAYLARLAQGMGGAG